MGCSNIPTPVFIDTNLGTRLAASVYPDITAKDLKRELEAMHLNCFPEIGRIWVNALMVKLKSRRYHLSESLPLKCAFLGSNLTWFLQMDVHPRSILDQVESLKCNDTELHSLDSTTNVVSSSPTYEKKTKCKRKREKKNVKQKCKIGCEKLDNNVNVEAQSDTVSEPASVSGIIKKYFSDYDEVASGFTTVRGRHRECLSRSNVYRFLNIGSEIMNKPRSEESRKKGTNPEVGRRLVLASEGIGHSLSSQRHVLSLCRFSGGNSTDIVRNLVFEMADESD